MSKKPDIDETVDRKKLLVALTPELYDILRVARYTLDSWPMRMSIEIASGMTEERLETLAAKIEEAIKTSTTGGV